MDMQILYQMSFVFAGLGYAQSASWENSDYNFEQYLLDFRISHSWKPEEFEARRQIFQNERARVNAHNSGYLALLL